MSSMTRRMQKNRTNAAAPGDSLRAGWGTKLGVKNPRAQISNLLPKALRRSKHSWRWLKLRADRRAAA